MYNFFFFLLFSVSDLPRFGKPLNNLTISVGREAIFTCIVENLGPYKASNNLIIKINEKVSMWAFVSHKFMT